MPKRKNVDAVVLPPEGKRKKPGLAKKPRRSRNNEVTPFEAKVLVNRIEHGMSMADAAFAAGYEGSVDAAGARAAAIVKRHKDSNSELVVAMRKRHIDADRVAEVIDNGLNAMGYIKVKVDKDKEEIREVIDHNVRHKFVETVLDIEGARAPKKVEIENLTFEQRLMRVIIEDERAGRTNLIE